MWAISLATDGGREPEHPRTDHASGLEAFHWVFGACGAFRPVDDGQILICVQIISLIKCTATVTMTNAEDRDRIFNHLFGCALREVKEDSI
jgi:hypothetical protein